MPADDDWCSFGVAIPHIDWAALLEGMRLQAGSSGGGRRQGGSSSAAAQNRHVTQTDPRIATSVQLGAGVEVSSVRV